MPTTVQFRRGTTAQNNAFTGAAGELSIDTDLNVIRVHDNSTAGGEVMVGATATQTLTNKTLTSPTINSATIAMGTNKITGMGDPTSAQDAATKAYVDGELSSLSSNSLTQGDTNWTITDSGTGSIVATVDNTTHSTFAAAGITLSQGAFVGNLTGDVTGNADSATALATGRTISLTGDVTGTSGSFDGSGNVSIAATIAANSVALGTDTTGNYVATITGGTGIDSSGATSGEGVAHTLSIDSTVATLTGSQTLTNKTLTSPVISTISNTGTLTLPTSTGTIALTSDIPTNNNQLTNGAGYTTNTGDITNVAVSGTGLSGGGASGSVTITSNATSANTASTIVARDGSGNFSAGVITGTSTAARYADLAEKYTSDADYDPGTVLVFGGDEEVTECNTKYNKRIAGIVSTDPAYLMNSEGLGVTVALLGRVPCKVIGEIRKGDLMVSSDTPGHAQAWNDESNPPAGSVIGKALENKTGAGADVIEVVVGKI
jgi:hypothetical protein